MQAVPPLPAVVVPGDERPIDVGRGEKTKQVRQPVHDVPNCLGRDNGGHVAKGVGADIAIQNTGKLKQTHCNAEGQEREQKTNA